jgi:hypothetical protein
MRLRALLITLVFPFPAGAQVLTSTNLPIVIINTNNQQIPDEPKIMATMGIIYNGPGVQNNISDPHNNYNGKIGIEVRGSSSQMFPKKSYGLETWTPLGLPTDVSLLGMPAENDWILSANYTDKSLMNNVLAYRLATSFGNYASRTRYVEVVLNGQYEGIYILMEKVKRDSNRVDIASLLPSDTAGANLTGGYMLKIDKFTGSSSTDGFPSVYPPLANQNGQDIYFQYEYPSADELHPKQKQYIKSFVDSFENALKNAPLYDTAIGWRRFGNENSFIRYLVVNELAKNVDGYRISTYLYKKKITDGNKLFVGPAWDYDIAFGNADYCGGEIDTGWAYNFGEVCPWDGLQIPFWWPRLMQDTLFQNKLKCAYTNWRANELDTVKLFDWIDSTATALNSAQARNFTKWPILGVPVWPNPQPLPLTYAGEISELKSWLRRRIAWLDANIPGTCWPPPLSVPELPLAFNCAPHPNPFNNELTLTISTPSVTTAELRLYSMDGKLVMSQSLDVHAGNGSYKVLSAGVKLVTGVYILQVRTADSVQTFRLLRQD